jgi:CHAT domain-containing protein/Flp pilus assembly protein TadD
MKILSVILLLFCTLQSSSQILKNIKNKAANKAKENTIDRAKYEARNAYYQKMNDIRNEFDSSDFDYAILVSDNAGLFNLRDKREMGSKFMNLKNIGSQLYHKDIELSDEEKALFNLHAGQSSYAMGRYLYAEKRFQAAQEYFERGYLTGHPGYMKTISNEGLLYATMGRYSQAQLFTEKALAMRRQAMGDDDMEVAASLNNYAVLHYNLGRYNESEKELEEALSIISKNKMQQSVQNGIVLNNKAMLYQALGRFEDAEKLMQQVVAIGEGLDKNVKTGNRVKFMSNLALLYQQMGRYNDAENIYMKMQKRITDRTTPEFANVLNNVAILYLVMNKQDKVEEMLLKAGEIYKKNFGENSPAYAKVISDLGNYYRYSERYTEALPLLEKAVRIREQALGSDHPLLAQVQEDIAILYWKTKDFGKAYPLYKQVMEKSMDFINSYFPPMSESEKSKYWDLLSPRFQRFFNFALDVSAINKEALTDMFEYRLATKGLLLHSTKKIMQSILNSGNEQLLNDYRDWIDGKEQLARLYAFSKEELQEQGLNLDSLQRAVNQKEKKLSESSKDFSKFIFTSKPRFTDVQAKLKTDEALVEIIRLRTFEQIFTDSSRYIAMVVSKGNNQPRVVYMNNGYDMEKKIFKGYRKSMQNRINDEQSYNYFWAPIETEVKGKKKIFISPDGVYNQVNLYTLKKTGADFLISQYDFILIGNGKDLLTDNTGSTVAGKKAALIGDPDYGSDKKLPPLPATKTEVDGINKMLKSSGYQVEEYTQQDATETNLKSTKEISVLHIATHGFFFPDVEKASWPVGVHADNAKDNVLLRSGLMLSGAVESDKINPTMDSTNNGIITSYEAMNLDLKGTRLVVLSACETGLGDVKAGEGVYGLQRAFLVAGADALIMSLWKVDDGATQQLMNNFYAIWVKGGDKQKAFKQAQQQLMTKYKEPYYWGAFVMMEN